MEIGELHATYLFETTAHAKRTWEKIAKRCRNISVNRWSVDGTPQGGVAVTVLTEGPTGHELTKAKRLAVSMGGREIEPPDHVLHALRAKRHRTELNTGGRKVVVRSPQGVVISHDGRHMGPVRRPQG